MLVFAKICNFILHVPTLGLLNFFRSLHFHLQRFFRIKAQLQYAAGDLSPTFLYTLWNFTGHNSKPSLLLTTLFLRIKSTTKSRRQAEAVYWNSNPVVGGEFQNGRAYYVQCPFVIGNAKVWFYKASGDLWKHVYLQTSQKLQIVGISVCRSRNCV